MALHLFSSVEELLKSFVILLLLATIFSWIYASHRKEHSDTGKSPRTIPYKLSTVKSTFFFLFNGAKLITYASRIGRNDPVIRIPLLTNDLYLVHGAKNIAEAFRATSLSVTWSMGFVLVHCFGMSKHAADVYHKDTTGPREKPNIGSKTEPPNRIYYKTHETLLEGLLRQGLVPMTDRLEVEMRASISTPSISDDWTYFPDLMEFYEVFLGTTVIRTIFGSTLLSLNPDFVRDLWNIDGVVMTLAKRLPIVFAPRTYWLRRKLLLQIKRWHAYARARSAEHQNAEDKDSDPYWGCKMIRDRYKTLRATQSQDDDSMASTDLAFIWTSVTNVVPSSMALLLHTIGDSSVFLEVQQEVARATDSASDLTFRLKQLEQQPLLLSLYAETLRFGVQIHIPRHTPHQALNIGDQTIPSNKVLIFNTWLAHTDKAVWNTKHGTHPIEQFWARRFLIDPKDADSGPIKSRHKVDSDLSSGAEDNSKVRFSTDGLEGAWIPYGGGHHACPGRVLAKRIMLLSCATMITKFDIELLKGSNQPKFGPSRFGLGVQVPVSKVPFRIRLRQNVTSDQ